ncbi:ABC transporter ATP-binding protein [Chelativorans sp. AA-79]|uniref:ABC transporter ATP-binding protein n=1 Tax=Chelativorans sp. AA-79 TaxID=3028735 RepID=UPI0023F6E625|nr:ABC transporter ATP-binding protein [Chelativorans sp. AA-79]WEX11756.1 ABC transporter ATP-binding protein [Chelativorans sp. AA-79]
MAPLLATQGLSRSFGGLKAVDGVDFSLLEGEIRAIIGPNGAGKTTLVSLICGRIAASSGSVFFDGRDISRLPAHKRVRAGIAYTFQITSIFSDLTVFDNVALAVQRHLLDDETARFSHQALARQSFEALEKVGLARYVDARAGNLSYGHQRLVEIAMGLALKPRLLILDEPTQGLSDEEIRSFIALVREIGKSATVLLIEHNMDVVMALAGRITVMEQGRILAEGTPEEIRADKAVQHAYLGSVP